MRAIIFSETVNRMLEMPSNKVVIRTLCGCFFGVVALFLYSEYRPSSVASDHRPLSVSDRHLVSPIHPPSHQKDGSNTLSSSVVEQPDKSLPIPAHQLKKIIAESSDAAVDELQQKIERLDKKLAAIDQTLPNNGAVTPSIPSTATAQGDPPSNDEIEQRIQHLRDHLEQ